MPQHRGLLTPTTHAQVSGHRFLTRRMHHGLVFGDARMIHDPLRTRQRAATLGAVFSLLLAMGAGLLAVLDPKPTPGEDEPLLRAASGALYVRVGEKVHPVANLASARLVVGEPAEPADIGDEALAGLRHGHPLGILDAPGLIAARNPEEGARTWSVCTGPDRVLVALGPSPVPLAGDEAVVLRDPSASVEYLVTARGRRALPPPDDPAGLIVRRRMGIDERTPVWQPPAPVLMGIAEREPIAFPAPLPEVVRAGEEWWAATAEGARTITELQATMLRDIGAASRAGEQAEMAARPEMPQGLLLPERSLTWIDPGETELCSIGAEGGVGRPTSGTAARAPVELPVVAAGGLGVSGGAPGEAPGGETRGRNEAGVAVEAVAARLMVADSFSAELRGAVAVDAGFGYHVVTPHGVRHRVDNAEALAALGLPEPIPGWWPALALLPEGSPLSRDEALQGGG
ncbi:type VII secretion protein EccB [Corynebacterium mastitidis]|uniref:Type VII secretion protein EccB n=1 Tax=Corynebacterium mastitidis TaxID=161890 RepID=A0ABU8NXR6_9CORY